MNCSKKNLIILGRIPVLINGTQVIKELKQCNNCLKLYLE